MPSPRSPIVVGKVATYARMSTDHQRYSIENQTTAMETYAAARGLEIVKAYADPGRGGVTLRKRPGLTQLLGDVLAGEPGFSALLVYDISRWGRFQDADESAHYEFMLRRAGVPVVYCAEPFENDGTPLASILKSIKRAMAGEYSRELSVKTSAGHMRSASHGNWQGSTPTIGLRRCMYDERGSTLGTLERGERKWLPTGRSRLGPGPSAEVEIVRWIFGMYALEGLDRRQILARLKADGTPGPYGRTWTYDALRRLLKNEAYAGTAVYGKTSIRLGGKRRYPPPSDWVRVAGAFEPIIDPQMFDQAQEAQRRRSEGATDKAMLDALRAVLARAGRLSATIIDADPECFSSSNYYLRFGGVTHAYKLIGYDSPYVETYAVNNPRQAEIKKQVEEAVMNACAAAGISLHRCEDLIRSDADVIVDVLTIRCQVRSTGLLSWHMSTKRRPHPDWRIGVRLDPGNSTIRDYLLVPAAACPEFRFRTSDRAPATAEPFRFDDHDAMVSALVGHLRSD